MAEKVVLLTNPIHPDGEAVLAGHARLLTAPDAKPETLRALAAEADGIIVRSKLPDDIVDHAPRLRGIVRHGVGLDFIPMAAASAKGIPVANLPGSNTRAVAEYVFAALMHLRRPLSAFDLRLRDAGWGSARESAGGAEEIGGTMLGVIGVGAVGARVAAIAHHGFGMRVVGASRRKGHMPPEVEELNVDDVFAQADAVVLSCALTEETRGLADARRLGLMKPGAVLINVSRGAVVDSVALVAALKQTRLAGAACDVFEEQPLPPESPFFDCPNLLLTPHLAAITETSVRAMSVGAAEEMRRILEGKPPRNLANPELARA